MRNYNNANFVGHIKYQLINIFFINPNINPGHNPLRANFSIL